MAEEAKETLRPVILISATSERDTIDREYRITVNADVKVLTADGSLRNMSFSTGRWEYPGWHEMTDLRIFRAWRSESDIRHGYKLPVIAGPHYSDVYSVELPKAAAMVRILGRINRGMAKLDEKLGSLSGEPADYLTRVASVLKIPTFATHKSGKGGFWDDGETRVMGANSAHYHVTELFRQFDRDQADRGVVSERPA